MPLDPRPRFAVAHYLTEPTIYRKWFFPQLDNALGPLWPLILIIAVAAAVYIAVRSRNVILRVIAAAALLTAVVYIFTPLTAAGQEGSPTGFFTNTRYLMPGLVLALVLLPIARPLRAPDTPRLADAALPHRRLRDHRADDAALVPGLHRRHRLPHPGPGLGAGRPRAVACAGARSPAAIVASSPAAWSCWRWCSDAPRRSSTTTTTTRVRPVPAGRRAAGGLRIRPALDDKRIGIAGSGEIFFGQYGFYGANLDNYVQYIGVPGRDGHLPAGDQLPAVPPPDQRRRLRLPDRQPVHPGLARLALLVSDLCLAENAPRL